MIRDYELLFADDFDMTSIAFGNSGYLRASSIDLGIGTDGWFRTQTPDIGNAGNMDLVIQATEDFAGAGAVGTFELHHSANQDMSSPTIAMGAISVDENAKAGDQIYRGAVPKGFFQQYMNLQLAVATASFTAGMVDAFITRAAPTV